MIDFRKASLDELDKIQNIAIVTWPATFGGLISSDQIKYMLKLIYNQESLKEQILDKGHQFIMVEKYSQEIGFFSYEINHEPQSHLMIHKIYILPKSQGQGIGLRILNFLSNTALNHKINQLRLKVFHKNEKALGFYKKYGFKSTVIEKLDIGQGYQVEEYEMIKNLTGCSEEREL